MIEVFKTNVHEAMQADKIINLLLQHFPASRINFDLDDCDKILRIEGNDFSVAKVIGIVQKNGFVCDVLL